MNGCESDRAAKIRVARFWCLGVRASKAICSEFKGPLLFSLAGGRAKRAADDSCHPLFSSPFKSISITGIAQRARRPLAFYPNRTHTICMQPRASHSFALSPRERVRDLGEKSDRLYSQHEPQTATDTYANIIFNIC
jgi:hypothetical protein